MVRLSVLKTFAHLAKKWEKLEKIEPFLSSFRYSNTLVALNLSSIYHQRVIRSHGATFFRVLLFGDVSKSLQTIDYFLIFLSVSRLQTPQFQKLTS